MNAAKELREAVLNMSPWTATTVIPWETLCQADKDEWGKLVAAVNASLEAECQRLRGALVKVVDNLGNGGKVSADCSLDFLCDSVPNEVRLEISALKYQALNPRDAA